MYEEDRLQDGFYTETELHDMAVKHLSMNRYSEEPAHIVMYHLFKDGVNTGLVMIIAVKYIIDGQQAINQLWSEAGITAVVGEYNDESPLNQVRLEAMYLLLNKHKYEGRLVLPGSDKVYRYAEWMGNLV